MYYSPRYFRSAPCSTGAFPDCAGFLNGGLAFLSLCMLVDAHEAYACMVKWFSDNGVRGSEWARCFMYLQQTYSRRDGLRIIRIFKFPRDFH